MVEFVEGFGYLFGGGTGSAIVWNVKNLLTYPRLTKHPTVNNGCAIVTASGIWVRIK